MDFAQQLGVALGLGTLSGVNLYLTVLVAGLAVKMKWIALSGAFEHLGVLDNNALLAVAGVLFFIDFFLDKTPWADSL